MSASSGLFAVGAPWECRGPSRSFKLVRMLPYMIPGSPKFTQFTACFFHQVWAVMRLQVVPENIGGAGGNRVDWEIDDAVFKEAA